MSIVPATQEDNWTVRHASLFGRLPESVLSTLLDQQTVRVTGKAVTLCEWGAPVETCFVVLKGMAKLVRSSAEGEAAVLSICGPGRTLMLAEGLSGKPCSATVESVTPVRLMALDVAALRRSMATDSKLSMTLLAAAAADLRLLVGHVEELKAMTGPVRVAAMILNLSEARAGARALILPYEKQLIAGRLGMAPENFSRALKQLREYGVQFSRDRLQIADLGRLRAFLYERI